MNVILKVSTYPLIIIFSSVSHTFNIRTNIESILKGIDLSNLEAIAIMLQEIYFKNKNLNIVAGKLKLTTNYLLNIYDND